MSQHIKNTRNANLYLEYKGTEISPRAYSGSEKFQSTPGLQDLVKSPLNSYSRLLSKISILFKHRSIPGIHNAFEYFLPQVYILLGNGARDISQLSNQLPTVYENKSSISSINISEGISVSGL